MALKKDIDYVILPDGVLKDGKACTRMVPVDNIGDEALAFGKSKRKFQVGHVYRIPTDVVDGKPTTFNVGSATWLQQHVDASAVAAWQAEQKAKELKAAEKASEKKYASSTSELDKSLEPLRLAYNKLPHPHRLAFELYVLSVLRRSSSIW